jgi:hypothetical protein
VFDEDSIQVVDIAAHEEHFVSTSADPQIHLKPRAPLAPGWWQFVLKLTGELVKPCVYLDFGSGYSQTWAIPLCTTKPNRGIGCCLGFRPRCNRSGWIRTTRTRTSASRPSSSIR